MYILNWWALEFYLKYKLSSLASWAYNSLHNKLWPWYPHILDSAADQAELLEGDEVLEINDEVITERNRGYCMLLINGSLQKNGKLNVFIKRDPSKSKSRRMMKMFGGSQDSL